MPVGFEIHPTIGIARLGASEGFFIGPEPGLAPPPSYRDGGGILRQAARFRIFRVDRDGIGAIRAADEITNGDAEIEWTVHLANRKATALKLTKPDKRRKRRTAGVCCRYCDRRGQGSDHRPWTAVSLSCQDEGRVRWRPISRDAGDAGRGPPRAIDRTAHRPRRTWPVRLRAPTRARRQPVDDAE